MRRYVKSDDYVRVGNLTLPTDASGYGYESAEEISRDTQRKLKAEADAREAEERRLKEEQEAQERMAQGAILYDQVIRSLDTTASIEDQLDSLFKALVPSSGKCDNLASELVRAMMRLMYRDFNDGDLFYEGYGIETCLSSASFLIDFMGDNTGTFEILYSVAENGVSSASYTEALNQVAGAVIEYLIDTPELFGTATPDSRDYSSRTNRELLDATPKYEYEVDTSGYLEDYIAHGCIDWGDVEYWLDELAREWGGDVDSWALDAFNIVNLDRDGLEAWEDGYFDALNTWLDSLAVEFPNFGEDDEDEYDEDEYDEDEDEEL